MIAGAEVDGVAEAFLAAQNGDFAGAIAIYRAMLAGDPANKVLHYSLGQLLLTCGKFAEGWEQCEWREQRTLPVARWQGQPLNGRGIILHGEQGHGDNFQFVRYAAQVAQRGGRVIVATLPGLRSLMGSVPGVARAIESGESADDIACHIPMLSLPHIFATRLATIPAKVPYMRADPARIEAWRRRLAPHPGLKVGVVWSGSHTPYNWRRSPGLRPMLPLFECPGVSFFVLQKGDGRNDLAEAPLPAHVVDLDSELTSFDETAAAMMALDLVVTPCTSTAHLAGALARPVWIVLGCPPDWRWLLERSDSPWYPTARLFRAEVGEDWSGVISRLGAALAERSRTNRPPS